MGLNVQVVLKDYGDASFYFTAMKASQGKMKNIKMSADRCSSKSERKGIEMVG